MFSYTFFKYSPTTCKYPFFDRIGSEKENYNENKNIFCEQFKFGFTSSIKFNCQSAFQLAENAEHFCLVLVNQYFYSFIYAKSVNMRKNRGSTSPKDSWIGVIEDNF